MVCTQLSSSIYLIKYEYLIRLNKSIYLAKYEHLLNTNILFDYIRIIENIQSILSMNI